MTVSDHRRRRRSSIHSFVRAVARACVQAFNRGASAVSKAYEAMGITLVSDAQLDPRVRRQ